MTTKKLGNYERGATLLSCLFSLYVVILLILGIHAQPSDALAASKSKSKSKSSLLHQVEKAMQLTTASLESNNITQVNDACLLWENVLQIDDPPQEQKTTAFLPLNIRVLCMAFQASCLARVGRDEDALKVYDSTLAASSVKKYLNEETFEEVQFGRARVLQRLMKYEEAKNQYLQLCKTTSRRALTGAITCLLRLRKLEEANEILEERIAQLRADGEKNGAVEASSSASDELLGLALGVRMLLSKSCDDLLLRTTTTAKQKDHTFSTSSPLVRWLLALNGVASRRPTNNNNILDLAAVNQSPFDDPQLIHLDDKIKLHELLLVKQQKNTNDHDEDDSTASSFWPVGYILPRELDKFINDVDSLNDDETNKKNWILKTATGYGSHGNQIVTAAEAKRIATNNKSIDSSSKSKDDNATMYLCQRMVSPPFLLRERKFSMRVYVYYFAGSDDEDDAVYLSRLGLLKLASRPYDSDNEDDRIHMTNSGREEEMLQYDFEYLEKYLDSQEGLMEYELLWDRITDAVKSVMKRYARSYSSSSSSYRQRLDVLGIPKILGFDFMIATASSHTTATTITGSSPTTLLEPKLLEVNRFPGLEPRGDGDDEVKRRVVLDAWLCAASRKKGATMEGGSSELDLARLFLVGDEEAVARTATGNERPSYSRIR